MTALVALTITLAVLAALPFPLQGCRACASHSASSAGLDLRPKRS